MTHVLAVLARSNAWWWSGRGGLWSDQRYGRVMVFPIESDRRTMSQSAVSAACPCLATLCSSTTSRCSSQHTVAPLVVVEGFWVRNQIGASIGPSGRRGLTETASACNQFIDRSPVGHAE